MKVFIFIIFVFFVERIYSQDTILVSEFSRSKLKSHEFQDVNLLKITNNEIDSVIKESMNSCISSNTLISCYVIRSLCKNEKKYLILTFQTTIPSIKTNDFQGVFLNRHQIPVFCYVSNLNVPFFEVVGKKTLALVKSDDIDGIGELIDERDLTIKSIELNGDYLELIIEKCNFK